LREEPKNGSRTLSGIPYFAFRPSRCSNSVTRFSSCETYLTVVIPIRKKRTGKNEIRASCEGAFEVANGLMRRTNAITPGTSKAFLGLRGFMVFGIKGRVAIGAITHR
jgi:hypothetical protein